MAEMVRAEELSVEFIRCEIFFLKPVDWGVLPKEFMYLCGTYVGPKVPV